MCVCARFPVFAFGVVLRIFFVRVGGVNILRNCEVCHVTVRWQHWILHCGSILHACGSAERQIKINACL